MNRDHSRTLGAVAGILILLAQSTLAQFAYVGNGGGSNNISAYRIDENGALSQIPGSPFAAGNLPSSVAVDPSGRFVYVVNEASNDVSGYRINKDGGLTPLSESPFRVGIDPHEVAVDPAGKFLYVVNAVDNNVSGFRIDGDGALIPTFEFAVPNG